MKTKKKLAGLTLLCLAALSVAGCSGDGKKETAGTGENNTSGEEKLAAEQVISIAAPQEVASIDTSTATDKLSFTVLNQLYEGFYRIDENNQIIPAGAAELAEKSEDGLTYTIKLREDAKWTNGDPVVAGDYVYGWQRTADPDTASEYAYLFESVKNGKDVVAGKKDPSELGIEAMSDYEVKITLDVATPYFDSLLAFPSFFPVNKKAVEEFGDKYASSSETSYYNGPFVLKDFDGVGSDIDWSYVKNEDYWDADTVKMTEIKAQVVKEASTGVNMYEGGELDDVILTGELAQQYRENEDYVTDKEGRTIYLEFNQVSEKVPFDNVNLRKAISLVVDNESIVENVIGDGSTSATGLMPTNLSSNPETGKDFTEETKAKKEFDEAKAKEYLEKAKKETGKDTFEFDILTDDNESTKKIAEYLQGTFKDVLGIETTVTAVTKPIRLDRTNNGEFDFVVTGWGADYNDPSSFMDLFQTGNSYNRGKYSNPAYDKLIKEAATTNATNPEARWQNFLDAEEILINEDAAVIPVYQAAEGHLRNPKLKGMIAHTAGASYEYKYMYLVE